MNERANLKHVSTTVLEELRRALVAGTLKTPIDRGALVGFGVRHQLDAIERALGGHQTAACVAVLDVAIAERTDAKPSPELVWTGPEAPAGAARDTVIVLRRLFEEARQTVILAGYDFDHATDVLAPLHRVMVDYGVDARFFVDIDQAQSTVSEADHVEAQLGSFLDDNWPFGDPCPHIYYDKRALRRGPPWSSLHAKCVVVDGTTAFVSSANFTQRGQERNIEVGVLLHDPAFATVLAAQWLGLIDAGLVAEYAK